MIIVGLAVYSLTPATPEVQQALNDFPQEIVDSDSTSKSYNTTSLHEPKELGELDSIVDNATSENMDQSRTVSTSER